jgi:hypothetical protein
VTRHVAGQLKSRQSGQERVCGIYQLPIANKPDCIWYHGEWHRRIFAPAYRLPPEIEQATRVIPGGKRFYLKMTKFGKGAFARQGAEKGDYYTIYNGVGVDLPTSIKRSTTSPHEWGHLYSLEIAGYARGTGLSAVEGSGDNDEDLEHLLVQGAASMLNGCPLNAAQHNVNLLVYPPHPKVRRAAGSNTMRLLHNRIVQIV